MEEHSRAVATRQADTGVDSKVSRKMNVKTRKAQGDTGGVKE